MLPCRTLARRLAIAGFAAGICFAQRVAPGLDREDDQAKVLWRLSVERDKPLKLRQLEEFLAEFPKDEAVGWIYDQIYSLSVEFNNVPRALFMGEKLLSIDPEDVELAYRNLKMAEGLKDPALVKKWSQIAADSGRRVIASPKDTEIDRRRLALAPQVITYVDYLAYADILQTPTRARKLELIEQATQTSPQSAYIPAMRRLTLAIWREIDPQKAVTIAEKMIEKDPTNEEALIMVAESYVQRDKEPEKALAYGEKVVALMEHTAKVEGIPDAEWSKKRAGLMGRANWLIGSISMQRGNFSQADKAIRAALPYLKGDQKLVSTALFYLGWANYRTGNIAEAIRFNQDCTRIRGPYQEQAFKNLAVIQSENPTRP